MEHWHPSPEFLRGARVVITARMPETGADKGDGPSSVAIEAEEAVTSLVRAIVANGGTVTLVGDEPLALLAGMVAGEYVRPHVQESLEPTRSSVQLVTSAGDESSLFAHLRAIGQADVRASRDLGVALAEAAVEAAAMVCVGQVSASEVSIFREHARLAPVFALVATLAGNALPESVDVDTIDLVVEREYPLPRPEHREDEIWAEPEPALPAMALTAQLIVERLIDLRDRPLKNRR